MENLFEQKWFEAKNKSVSELVAFINESPAILKKYKFDKFQSEIISKLLKSNDKFWYDIEEGTENSRKKRTVINDIEEKVNSLTEKIVEEKAKATLDQERLNFLLDELAYIEANFDPETNTLITYDAVNKNYDDIDLVFFFVEYAEKIDTFIENTMDREGLFSKADLFLEYFTKLFAFNLNGIGIEFGDNEIKLTTVVDDEDIDAVEQLNDNN